jgi:kumamolisin
VAQAPNYARRTAGAIIAAASAGAMLALGLTAAPAGAAGTPAKAAVPQAITPAALGATPVFPVKPGTPETVSFVLKLRNKAKLETWVNGGIRRHFVSVAQFHNWYGQPQARISALEAYLHRYKIKTRAYADGIDVSATGTAAEFNRALSVSQAEYTTKAVPAHHGHAARPAVTFRAAKDEPLLPASLARYVETIVGLDDYPMFGSSAVRTRTAEPAKAVSGVFTGNRKPADFARNYGLTSLYSKGAHGQGQTIGVITFASVRTADATHFWSRVLKIKTKNNRIRLANIDGGSGPVSSARGSDETTLDVEQSGALAPQSSIVVYQAPNSDVGNVDAYAAAASQNVAGTVSSSWGESETLLAAGDAAGTEPYTLIQANDEFMLEMAAQGQANFTASGDEAAYAASGDLGSTNLSVGNAPDSPWTTAAGGTTLPGVIPLYSQVNSDQVNVRVTSQRAWGWDWQWPYYSLFLCNTGSAANPSYQQCSSEAQFAAQDVVGSGGGYSQAELRPGYQAKLRGIARFTAVPYLTPTDFTTAPGSTLVVPMSWSVWDAVSGSAAPPAAITGQGNGRVVPDISADADPYTGYEEYFSGFPGNHLELGWGGTSFVSPQLNGSAAVIDSYLRHRVGFWNPAIYKFAATRNTPFHPENATGSRNDNIYYTGTKGALYNPATGLGPPNLAKLAADFARYGW